MAPEPSNKNKRRGDAYMDRRSGEDRRQVHYLKFFAEGGVERRRAGERREAKERRQDCIRVSKWSSVCVGKISREPGK